MIDKSKISLRHARMIDSKNLLNLKNDPVVRMFSIVSKEEIKEVDHNRWFWSLLNDPLRTLYVIENEGQFVGDIRLDEKGSNLAEVSIRIENKYRLEGIGYFVLSDLIKKVGINLQAKIVEGNIASLNLFTKARFKFISYDAGVYTLYLPK